MQSVKNENVGLGAGYKDILKIIALLQGYKPVMWIKVMQTILLQKQAT